MRMSTRTHAILDLATAGFALLFPRIFGASKPLKTAITAIALGKIGYTLLTRHEAGLAKVLPMKTHLTLDTIGGVTLCTLPFLLDQQKNENRAVTACALGLGLFDIAAAPLTQTQSQPPVDRVSIERPGDLAQGETGRDRIPAAERLPMASLGDTLKMQSRVVIPNIAKGPIIRRPRVTAMAERLDLDTAAVKTLQQMRAKYGNGPLMKRLAFRNQAVLLDPDDVRRVLDESPEPFATASTEKQAALAHFEPRMALVSHGPDREARRKLNEQALDTNQIVHHMAERFLPVVDEEAAVLLDRVKRVGELRWTEFFDTWFTIVRRIVFGNVARDDYRITDLMETLRSHGNWAFAKPVRTDLRDELHQRIRGYIEHGESGSLAAYLGKMAGDGVESPENQVPQWLFAFDPAAMATFRALALLAAHPQQMERAREETAGGVAADRPHRPLLRAAVLESLRLWPTTPMILRQTTRETEWNHGTMPAHTGILIFAPFFHRDDENLPYAHTFNPDVWIEDDPDVKGFPPKVWPFVPFSGGTAHCPGQLIVLLLTSGMLASIIGDRSVRLQEPHRMPPGALPGTQDNYTLRFALEGRGAAAHRHAAAGLAATR